jgi:hypothetical protein
MVLKGVRDLSSTSDLVFCLCLAFDRLLEFPFYSFLFFFFSLMLLYVGVVSALIKGVIEDHVWFEDRSMALSGVMSDSQRCVD